MIFSEVNLNALSLEMIDYMYHKDSLDWELSYNIVFKTIDAEMKALCLRKKIFNYFIY